MLVLLPPSETKRDGGDPIALSLDALSFSSLRDARDEVLTATSELAADADAMMRALKLGPRQAAEVDRNRRLSTSPTMPALDRYTGVLYDALDAVSLDRAARAYAAEHVAVHSALFGIVGADDPIPAYRLSHDSRLPGLRLKGHWREPIRSVLAGHTGLIVDLRSEGYVELGPAPVRPDSVFLRVVSVDSGGRRRALNHFNKRAKGLFTRALLETRPTLNTRDDLLAWSSDAGFRLELGAERPSSPAEIELVA
ncbi:YaaA family protein [Agromyces kandeliae]|uniref:Peroxide stress protein YaaA n=1 Tax=Agromyces kandeliae TaxID=2666141 RepID=A0A6L5R031_9MICO|nr:peroxide stress protein YaaA [Agromyces kandeliae]MRX42788.1 peroxide stress protein YaaA [Agromyces kandeliae]